MWTGTKPSCTKPFTYCGVVLNAIGPLSLALLVAACNNAPKEGSQESQTAAHIDDLFVEPATCVDLRYDQAASSGITPMTTASTAGTFAQAVSHVFNKDPIDESSEVHDCQQFIRGNGYGPYVSVVGFKDIIDLKTDKVTTVGGITAVRGKYEPLHIVALISCIAIKPAESPDQWQAWIYPMNPKIKCDDPEDDPSSKYKVDVWPGDSYKGVPAMRIIEEDEKYYIGLPCLGRWCILGLKHESASQQFTSNLANFGSDQDEQRLSYRDQATNNLRPSKIVGTVTSTGIHSTNPDFYQQWQPVAVIRFRGSADDVEAATALKDKYGVRSLEPADLFVWLRYDATLSPKWRIAYGTKPQDTDPGRPAKYNDHHRGPGPGAARWRWSETDEGVWVQCYQGCCTGA